MLNRMNIFLTTRNIDRRFIKLIIPLLAFPLPAFPKTNSAGQNEIQVTLLSRPCTLQGPFDEKMLHEIHSIGPDQIYPELSVNDPILSISFIDKSLKKLSEVMKSSNRLPDPLFRYCEKLQRRLTAQKNFFTALGQSKKTSGIEPLTNAAKAQLNEQDLARFEGILKKNREQAEDLLEVYNEGIEADPEQEFHRAIKKLHVQYACSFE